MRLIVFSNLKMKQFFFSMDSSQEVVSKDFVPISGTKFYDDVDDLALAAEREAMTFQRDKRRIPNPDPEFRPSFVKTVEEVLDEIVAIATELENDMQVKNSQVKSEGMLALALRLEERVKNGDRSGVIRDLLASTRHYFID